MGPFDGLKTLRFLYNESIIEWQLQKSDCFSFIRCNHPFFIDRFGHKNILVQKFETLFEQIESNDIDYDFFQALQESAKTYLLSKEAQ